MFLPIRLEALLLCVTPLLLGFGSAPSSPPVPKCAELLALASQELGREQYPTMLTLAQERQLLCPGPESDFLAGVARANMLDKLLVAEAERPFVREQALVSLRHSVRDLRPDWQQTALTWITYLDALPQDDRAAASREPTAAGGPDETSEPPVTPRVAAPPWEPEVFPWGPVLMGGAGVMAIGAGLVTYILAARLDAEIDRAERVCTNSCSFTDSSRLELSSAKARASTLFTTTHVLSIAGAVTLSGAVMWYLLRPTPAGRDPELAVVPWFGREGAGAQLRARF